MEHIGKLSISRARRSRRERQSPASDDSDGLRDLIQNVAQCRPLFIEKMHTISREVQKFVCIIVAKLPVSQKNIQERMMRRETTRRKHSYSFVDSEWDILYLSAQK